jgi:hypothetical protein
MTFYKPRTQKHLKLVPDLPKTESSEETKSGWKLARPKNEDVRSREFLRPHEVDRLIAAAKSTGRCPLRHKLNRLQSG